MVENLQYSLDSITWTYNGKDITLNLDNIIFASEDINNELVIIETGENFQTRKVFSSRLDGQIEEQHDIDNGCAEWVYNNQKKEISINGLLVVGYYPRKGIILIMHESTNREVIALDLDGEYLFEFKSPEGFKMLYFQEFPEYVTVVCDGDTNHVDKLGRGMFNFKIDITNGGLEKVGLA